MKLAQRIQRKIRKKRRRVAVSEIRKTKIVLMTKPIGTFRFSYQKDVNDLSFRYLRRYLVKNGFYFSGWQRKNSDLFRLRVNIHIADRLNSELDQ